MSDDANKRERSSEAAEGAEQPTKKAAKGDAGAADADPAVVEKVVGAIRRLKSHTGSSIKAIQKAIGDDVPAEDIKKAVKFGLAQRTLSQVKQSFMVQGETYADPTPKIEILSTTGTGTGEPVKKDQKVKVAYKGTLEDGGSAFDAGSISFRVGEGSVIKGLEQGVLGLREGETRVVKIPPSLGYGKRGSGKTIPPNATLIFELQLAQGAEDDPSDEEDVEEEEEEHDDPADGDNQGDDE